MNNDKNENALHPWMQQEWENNLDFQLFNEYLNMEGKRSYQEVANLAFCSVRTIAEMGRKNKWVNRAAQYDKYVNSNLAHKYSEKIQKLRHREQEFQHDLTESAINTGNELLFLLDNYLNLYDDERVNKKINFIIKVGKALNLMNKIRKVNLSPEFEKDQKRLIARLNEIYSVKKEDFIMISDEDIDIDKNPDLLKKYDEEEQKNNEEFQRNWEEKEKIEQEYYAAQKASEQESKAALHLSQNENHVSAGSNKLVAQHNCILKKSENLHANDANQESGTGGQRPVEQGAEKCQSENQFKASFNSNENEIFCNIDRSRNMAKYKASECSLAPSVNIYTSSVFATLTAASQALNVTGENPRPVEEIKPKAPNVRGLFYEPALDPESEDYDPEMTEDDFDRGEIYDKIRQIEV